jgi:hypothetical protein
MERRLTEEQITKAIIHWLEQNDWEIVCFDFPQSGTGISLHPNKGLRTTKNKGAFIPDIVAIREGVVIFLENKDRFVLADFLKVDELRRTNNYGMSIKKLLDSFTHSKIYYGVGLPRISIVEEKTKQNIDKVDFVISVLSDGDVSIEYQIHSIF